MGIFGKPNIEKLQARQDINGLVKALTDPGACRQALLALGQLNAQEAVPDITRLSKDPAMQENIDAVFYTLGNLKGKTANDWLLGVFENDEIWGGDEKRIQMIADHLGLGLGMIKDPASMEPLIKQLKNPDFHRCKAAIHALRAMGNPASIPPLFEALAAAAPAQKVEIISELKFFIHPEVARRLVEYYPVPSLCQAVFQALEYITRRDPGILEMLKESLDPVGAPIFKRLADNQ